MWNREGRPTRPGASGAEYRVVPELVGLAGPDEFLYSFESTLVAKQTTNEVH